MKIALGLVTGIVLLAGQNTGTPSSHGEDILSWVQWPAPMACPPQQQHAGASRWFAPTIMRHCGAGGIGSPGGRTAAPVRSVVNRALRRWRSRSRRRFGVIRATVRNRVDNQLFRPRVANRRRRRFGRLRARFSEPDHAAHSRSRPGSPVDPMRTQPQRRHAGASDCEHRDQRQGVKQPRRPTNCGGTDSPLWTNQLFVDAIVHQRADRPSRRSQRQLHAGEGVFPRCEPERSDSRAVGAVQIPLERAILGARDALVICATPADRYG